MLGRRSAREEKRVMGCMIRIDYICMFVHSLPHHGDEIWLCCTGLVSISWTLMIYEWFCFRLLSIWDYRPTPVTVLPLFFLGGVLLGELVYDSYLLTVITCVLERNILQLWDVEICKYQ